MNLVKKLALLVLVISVLTFIALFGRLPALRSVRLSSWLLRFR